MTMPTVRRVTIADTAMARALRLEMLADTPLAFIERLDEAVAKPHHAYRSMIAERADGDDAAIFVAAAEGRLVGQAGGWTPPGTTGVTVVFAVYLSPAWRGTGLLGRLVDAVGEWSVAAGRPVLELEVASGNHRAIRAYQRLGFADTGQRIRHPRIPVLTELRMRRPAIEAGESE
jgi:RimJ/RimL family protein N-acetyltransferase